MTLNFLDLYNEIAGQAWSMYDPDADNKDDFESALKSAINKALSHIWNSYNFTFKEKKRNTTTVANKSKYALPPGNIFKKTIGDKEVYSVKVNGKYISYDSSAEEKEAETGTPEYFYVSGDSLYLYPIPDKAYSFQMDYYSLAPCLTADGDSIYELSEDTDYINVPEKFETLFKNALMTLSMVYVIADETDENYSAYMYQYNKALSNLIRYQQGIDKAKRITW